LLNVAFGTAQTRSTPVQLGWHFCRFSKNKSQIIAASSKLMITEGERRFAVRIRLVLPAGDFGTELGRNERLARRELRGAA
jgi:hypothetical protein